MRVKICGISDLAGREAAEAADWIGFVFFARSPRVVTPERAASLAGAGGPARVGLFVEPGDAEVAAALAAVRLDALQVYASAERVAGLRARFGVPVWHALGIGGAGELPGVTGADALVIEARAPAGSDRPGGNAVRLDWGMLAGWRAPAPWLLGGGLTPANVGAAVAASGAQAVDVSSGVERAPGVKDPGLVRAFLAAARASEAGASEAGASEVGASGVGAA